MFKSVLVTLIGFSAVTFAGPKEQKVAAVGPTQGQTQTVQVLPVVDQSSGSKFEIGVVTGFPTAAGIQFGFWGPVSAPLLLRASFGIGSTLDFGAWFQVGNDSANRLFVVLNGGIFGYHEKRSSNLMYNLGPAVGVKLGAFFFEAGPTVYFQNSDYQFAAQGTLGVSFLL